MQLHTKIRSGRCRDVEWSVSEGVVQKLWEPESATFWVNASRVIPPSSIFNVKKQNEKTKRKKTKKREKV